MKQNNALQKVQKISLQCTPWWRGRVSWFCCQLQLSHQFRSLWGSPYVQYLSVLTHSFLKCEMDTVPTSEVVLNIDSIVKVISYISYIPICNKLCQTIVTWHNHHVYCYSWSCGLEMWAGLRGICSFLLYVVMVGARVAQCLPMWPLPPCGFYPPGSFSPHCDLSVQWGRLGFLAWQWHSKSENRSGYASPRKPFLWYSIGQSESPSQRRFKEWGNRLHLLMGGTAKSLCN